MKSLEKALAITQAVQNIGIEEIVEAAKLLEKTAIEIYCEVVDTKIYEAESKFWHQNMDEIKKAGEHITKVPAGFVKEDFESRINRVQRNFEICTATVYTGVRYSYQEKLVYVGIFDAPRVIGNAEKIAEKIQEPIGDILAKCSQYIKECAALADFRNGRITIDGTQYVLMTTKYEINEVLNIISEREVEAKTKEITTYLRVHKK